MTEQLLAREINSLKKFNTDLDWFQNNYRQLKRKYKGEYVAIKNKAVADHDKDPTTLLKRVRRKYGDISSLVVEYLTDKEIEYVL